MHTSRVRDDTASMGGPTVPPPPGRRAPRSSTSVAAVVAAALTVAAWSLNIFLAACLGVATLLLGGLSVGDVTGWRRGVVVVAMVIGLLPFVVLALAVFWVLPTMD